VDDLDRLARDMDRAPDDLADRADKLVRASTLQTEALGKATANVDTGFMRASITSEFERTADRSMGETGPTAWYSHFPHDGTSRIAPNPFMFRAADVVEPQFYAAAEALGASVLDG
jgi:HK97 gp10 family phage protein